MPTLDSHISSEVVKLLNIGESGVGKTGALASLARAGYRLWILDYDNGLDIVSNILRGKTGEPPDTEALRRITYETFRDAISIDTGMPRVKTPPTAYKMAGKTLKSWGVDAFTPQDVIVLDTLSSFSDMAFNEATFLGGRLNQHPQLQDYGWMATSVLLFLDLLTSKALNCHVVVNTHIRYLVEGEEAVLLEHAAKGDATTVKNVAGRPNAKGQEISRTVSRMFNTITLTRTMGSGAGVKRVICTQPQGVVEVRASNPLNVKASYPVEGGLAPLFQDLLGHGPDLSSKPTTALTQLPH